MPVEGVGLLQVLVRCPWRGWGCFGVPVEGVGLLVGCLCRGWGVGVGLLWVLVECLWRGWGCFGCLLGACGGGGAASGACGGVGLLQMPVEGVGLLPVCLPVVVTCCLPSRLSNRETT